MATAEIVQTSGRNIRKSVGIIGSGVAGLSAAWHIGKHHDVTVYEASDRIGGHSNTVTIPEARQDLHIDTGFIVYNEFTYPNLVALFRHLHVETAASDMSFAVSLDDGRLEYCGAGMSGLFAQKRNLLRPRFHAMIFDLVRFYRQAPQLITDIDPDLTLRELLRRRRYGQAFLYDHLLPMAGAIWSASPEAMLEYPALSFIRFFENHGLFNLGNRPVWRTVAGGSRSYVKTLAQEIGSKFRLRSDILAITANAQGVTVHDRRLGPQRHDEIVIATPATEALRLLDQPTPAEQKLLGKFHYSQNTAFLHRDPSLMPKRRFVWSSWNHMGRNGKSHVSYWMNKLQDLKTDKNYFLTLNPPFEPADTVYRTTYHHPLFDAAAMQAQRHLWSLQGKRGIWYCGSYCGSGFHEDALQAGLAVAEAISGHRRPWQCDPHLTRIGSEPRLDVAA